MPDRFIHRPNPFIELTGFVPIRSLFAQATWHLCAHRLRNQQSKRSFFQSERFYTKKCIQCGSSHSEVLSYFPRHNFCLAKMALFSQLQWQIFVDRLGLKSLPDSDSDRRFCDDRRLLHQLPFDGINDACIERMPANLLIFAVCPTGCVTFGMKFGDKFDKWTGRKVIVRFALVRH